MNNVNPERGGAECRESGARLIKPAEAATDGSASGQDRIRREDHSQRQVESNGHFRCQGRVDLGDQDNQCSGGADQQQRRPLAQRPLEVLRAVEQYSQQEKEKPMQELREGRKPAVLKSDDDRRLPGEYSGDQTDKDSAS